MEESKLINSLKIKLTKSSGEEKVDLLNNLAFQYYRIEPKLTKRNAKKALFLAKKLKYKNGIAKSFSNLGIYYHILNKYDKGLSFYLQALEIYEKSKQNEKIASVKNNIAAIYNLMKKYELAIIYQIESIKIFEKSPPTQGLAAAYHNIAVNYSKTETYEMALKYYIKSFEIKKILGDKQYYSFYYNNISDVYWKQEKYTLALKNTLKAKEYAEKYNDIKSIAHALTNLGMISSLYEKDDKIAIIHYKKALKHYNKLLDKYGSSHCNLRIGESYILLKKYDLAIRHLELSFKITAELKFVDLDILIVNSLALAYEAKGEYKKSLDYLKQGANFNKEEKMNKHIESLANLQTKYESEKKEKEKQIYKLKNVTLVNKNKKLKKEILDRKKAEKKIKDYTASKELLLQEVNHRVKNNLYTISSILYKEKQKVVSDIKKKKYNPKEFINELIKRIDGLSAVHKLLSSTNWQALHLNVLLEEITNYFFNISNDEDLEIRKQTTNFVLVNNFQAQQIALVYNEILTNTVKYSKVDIDKLDLNLDIQYGHKEKIIITFKDNGVGFPKKILDGDFSDTGIGFNLIFGIIEQSLGGSVEIYNDSGAVFVLTIKKDIKLNEGLNYA